MNASQTATKTKLKTLPFGAPVADVMAILERDGGVILENVLSLDQIAKINDEIATAVTRTRLGTVKGDEFTQIFHGERTKRLTSVVMHSQTYREAFVDNDIVHGYVSEIFRDVSETYWLNACQAIEIHPGEKAQWLHRDLGNYPIFYQFGPAGPEVMSNFLLAMCDVTEEIGATRVIPGSHLWQDYGIEGTQDMTVAATMKAGSALLIGGKILHGGGANLSEDRPRRVISTTFAPGFLVPEDAYPFVIPVEAARGMSPRLQQLLGFRSFHQQKFMGGSLWQVDYEELGDHLGLCSAGPQFG